MDKASSLRNIAEAALQKETEELAKAKQRHTAAVEAQQIAQQIAQSIQQTAHQQIAQVVSRCLESVFGKGNGLDLNFERKRGKTEASLGFRHGEHTVDPLTASGGGMVDIAAFAVRLAALVLSIPNSRRLLVLDEPMRFVSKEYQPAARALIESLATELGIQFIIVTHNTEYELGTIVRL